MAIYPVHGILIKTKVGTGDFTTLPGVVDGDVTMNQETIEVTEHSGRDRKYVQGIRSGTASLTVFYDQAAHGLFEAALKAGSEVTMQYTWAAPSGNTMSYEVACLVTSVSNKIAVNDVIRMSLSLQFTGEVSLV
jgi:predicted secreted protein